MDSGAFKIEDKPSKEELTRKLMKLRPFVISRTVEFYKGVGYESVPGFQEIDPAFVHWFRNKLIDSGLRSFTFLTNLSHTQKIFADEEDKDGETICFLNAAEKFESVRVLLSELWESVTVESGNDKDLNWFLNSRHSEFAIVTPNYDLVVRIQLHLQHIQTTEPGTSYVILFFHGSQALSHGLGVADEIY